MNEETKFTKGPLEVEFDESGGYDCMSAAYLIKSKGHIIVAIDVVDYGSQRFDDSGNEKAWADAHLFAAAYKLYERFEQRTEERCEIHKLLNPQHEHCTSCLDLENDLALLAEARGEIE